MLSQISSKIYHNQTIWSVAFHPSLPFFCTCSSDLNILVHPYPQNPQNPVYTLQTNHTKTLRHIAFHPSLPLMAVSSFDSTISIYHISQENDSYKFSFELVESLEGQEHEIKKLAFNDDFLASTSRDGSVWLWDKDFDCSNTLTIGVDVKVVTFCPQGLIVGGFDGFLRFYVQDDDEFIMIKKIDIGATIWDIVWHQNLSLAICSDDDGFITVIDCKQMCWDPVEEEDWEGERGIFMIQKIKGHAFGCYGISLNQHGNWLVSCGRDNRVVLYNKVDSTGDVFNQVDDKEQHNQDVNSISFHPQQDVFVSVGDDQKVILWEIN